MDNNVLTGTPKLKTPELLRLKKKMQLSFRRWIAGKSGGISIQKYIGTDLFSVREWLKDRMVDGMTWNNYGEKWVIDHIVPMRMFDIKNEEELKICWHYKNLMPLFKSDNLNKEGNVFFAFILLDKIKGEDYFYNNLVLL